MFLICDKYHLYFILQNANSPFSTNQQYLFAYAAMWNGSAHCMGKLCLVKKIFSNTFCVANVQEIFFILSMQNSKNFKF